MNTPRSTPTDDPTHEALCRRCGVSCHLALPVNDIPVVIPGLRCKYLSAQGAQWGCSVYPQRFELAPWCHHADQAGPQGFLAHDCPYTAGEATAPGKVNVSPETMERLWPAIFREICRVGVPEWIDQAAFLSAVHARESGQWVLTPLEQGRLRPTPSPQPTSEQETT